MAQRTTLAQIAKRAGVSTPTVSKVLNGRDDVSPATRERVQSVLDEVNYDVPGRRARKATDRLLVDFLCEGLSSAYAVEVLRGVLDHAAAEHVDVVVSQTDRGTLADRDYAQWAKRLKDEGRSGLILVVSEATSAALAAFRKAGVPVVVIDPLSPIGEDVVSVGATNWLGGRTATEHLLAAGHKRVAYVGGPSMAECHIARRHGYLAALDAHDINRDEDLILDGSFSTQRGVTALRELLALDEPPTAIFAASETTAVGIYEEAARHGIRIPEQLSVIGFDGTYLGVQTLPPMTTVAQPLQEMGSAALRLILRQAAHGIIQSHHVELATRLIERRSVTAPPSPAA
ncbi:MAG: LacI family DNA-binding transcriptional regulator [Mycetocola sp.]